MTHCEENGMFKYVSRDGNKAADFLAKKGLQASFIFTIFTQASPDELDI